jgi:hypothetical protein
MVTDVVVVLEDLLSVVVLGLLLYLFQAFPKNKIRNFKHEYCGIVLFLKRKIYLV